MIKIIPSHILQLIIVAFLFASSQEIKAQIIWTGPTTTFTKESNSDWLLAANQDRLTENVWITRGNNAGLFNIVTDSVAQKKACQSTGPFGTKWAYGKAENFASLDFKTIGQLIGCGNFKNIVNGKNMVLHLTAENIYLDIKFTNWAEGAGGFAYERSSDPALSASSLSYNQTIKVSPNPANQTIQIQGLKKETAYRIHSLLGVKIRDGYVSKGAQIEVGGLNPGLYFLTLGTGTTIKFQKR
jgi:hypothetical protein